MPEQFKDLHFPKAGVDVSQAFGRQPNRPAVGDRYARTCPVGQNVRAFEPDGQRSRGGSRPGLAKFIVPQMSGVEWVIQELATIAGTNFDQPSGTMPQFSDSGRVVTLVGVSRGTVYSAGPTDTTWTAAINATGEVPPLSITGLMQSATLNQKMFFADGTNWVYYDPKTNTLYPWVALSPGELPVDSVNNTPRLICSWNGCIVLSGLIEDPNSAYMSRQGNAFDWDYFPPDPGTGDPVALSPNSDFGQIGDVVTALIPYSDDTLIFGGDSSIYILRGHPNKGGAVDLVTKTIGMPFGAPWCQDPYGNVWFFSNRCGVYRYTPGQQPQRVSQQIEPMLQDLNTGDYGIRLLWDDRMQGMHMFVTYLPDLKATTHFFYESRSGSWWTDTFRNTKHNPLCCCVLDGNRPEDRIPLLGCWDGVVRAVQRTATDDDGYPIDSEVVIGPLLTTDMDELLLKELQTVLAEDSGNVTFSVYAGNTAEAALSGGVKYTGTWRAGRNVVSSVRRSGHALYVKISSTNRWAMEQIRALIGTSGNVRRRGR